MKDSLYLPEGTEANLMKINNSVKNKN